MIYLHDIAILLAEDVAQPTTMAPLSLRWISDAAEIHRALHAVGHRIDETRLQRRLNNDLRFVCFSANGAPAATSWVAAAGGRYIDELNWLMPIADGEYWLRDVFVAPAWRGRRVFAAAVAALSVSDAGGTRRIWSDVDRINIASMRAHGAAGFKVLLRVRALDFSGRLRLRCALPSWPLPITEIEPGSRVIALSGWRLRRHRDLLA